ncbi:hypothetical protein HN588_01110, partial [Candidatus Bathyarchaeota archaeon]|nr:hypothetical protein [Candidatus Bathyarchaeota archaeon]
MDNSVEPRRQVYFRLSSHLSQLSNEQLTRLLKNATSASEPNTALELGSDRVFAKRVPVTDLEHNNMLSTANYYRLPNYFNFTGGGGGLGVFREIVTYIKTTNWVLAGAIGCFPLLYHWRILPRSSAVKPLDEDDHREFVRRWNSNKRIDRFLRDKASAQYEELLSEVVDREVGQPRLGRQKGRERILRVTKSHPQPRSRGEEDTLVE